MQPQHRSSMLQDTDTRQLAALADQAAAQAAGRQGLAELLQKKEELEGMVLKMEAALRSSASELAEARASAALARDAAAALICAPCSTYVPPVVPVEAKDIGKQPHMPNEPSLDFPCPAAFKRRGSGKDGARSRVAELARLVEAANKQREEQNALRSDARMSCRVSETHQNAQLQAALDAPKTLADALAKDKKRADELLAATNQRKQVLEGVRQINQTRREYYKLRDSFANVNEKFDESIAFPDERERQQRRQRALDRAAQLRDEKCTAVAALRQHNAQLEETARQLHQRSTTADQTAPASAASVAAGGSAAAADGGAAAVSTAAAAAAAAAPARFEFRAVRAAGASPAAASPAKARCGRAAAAGAAASPAKARSGRKAAAAAAAAPPSVYNANAGGAAAAPALLLRAATAGAAGADAQAFPAPMLTLLEPASGAVKAAEAAAAVPRSEAAAAAPAAAAPAAPSRLRDVTEALRASGAVDVAAADSAASASQLAAGAADVGASDAEDGAGGNSCLVS
ncbi:hypothetical protein JKP88DRAFT_242491 [Tribonema minus]|uniref:Uncharacterized protein n=1 Tax=Tribonema minus TaxID=303371 RepID=A0A836C8S7_9STRA|nr:hypothetical protein JKP88DRAFT_242491 [Tribonema minus]